MSRRQPAPYFKKSHKSWYVQIGAKQHRLSDDYAEALARCSELLKGHKRAERFVVPGEPAPYSLGQLTTEFLRVAFKDRSPRTRGWYEEKLSPLVRHLGEEFSVDQVKPLHVEEWVGRSGSPPSTRTATAASPSPRSKTRRSNSSPTQFHEYQHQRLNLARH